MAPDVILDLILLVRGRGNCPSGFSFKKAGMASWVLTEQ
jgi:hypothetical protein